MQIDTFMTIGKNHKVCEDYILSGMNPIPYIIISDGCSSSKGTDMGARLLCFLSQQYIRFRASSTNHFEPDHDEMGLWIIHNAELVGKQLGLPKNALDATLIIGYQYTEDIIKVHFYGDGCVIHFRPNYGSIEIIEYSKNAPYYLSYKIDDERHNLYHSMNQQRIIKTYLIEPEYVEICNPYDNNKSVFNFGLSEIDSGLLIASDGLASFIKDEEGVIPFPSFVKNFFAFKTTKGEFLKRRANKELITLAKDGIYNYDDLSIGAFLLGSE